MTRHGQSHEQPSDPLKRSERIAFKMLADELGEDPELKQGIDRVLVPDEGQDVAPRPLDSAIVPEPEVPPSEKTQPGLGREYHAPPGHISNQGDL